MRKLIHRIIFWLHKPAWYRDLMALRPGEVLRIRDVDNYEFVVDITHWVLRNGDSVYTVVYPYGVWRNVPQKWLINKLKRMRA